MKNKKSAFGRLFSTYLKGSGVRTFLSLVLSAISAFFFVLPPAILGQLIDMLCNKDFDVEKLLAGLGVLISMYTISQAIAIVRNFMLSTIATRVVKNVRNDINEKMHRLKLDYYDTHTHGEVLSTITNDVESINQFLTGDLPTAIPEVFNGIGFLVMSFLLNIWLSIVALATIPLSWLASKGVLLASAKKFEEQQELLGEINGYIEENYNAQNVVSAFNYQKKAIGRFNEINDRLQNVSETATVTSGLVTPITGFVNNAAYSVIAIFGCLFAISNPNTLSVGIVQSILSYTQQLANPFRVIAGIMGSFSSASAASQRIFNFIDADEEIPDPENPKVPELHSGVVEFEHVKFGYSPDRLLMTDVNVRVEPGQKCAVVGPTGAGKTTLINLLMRFYEINGGSIKVNGVDTKEMTREELRKHFGMVLQDTWLFEGTIRDNLKYGGVGISDETIYEASKSANTDRFIKTLPGGYDMVLSRGAENISQGERQMLTIARAMATTPEIMILDEATSNVDTHTELLIQNALKKLMVGRTSFVIAHRLSTIKDADVILYMENGDIKEFGTHDELMALGGKYCALYNSQFE